VLKLGIVVGFAEEIEGVVSEGSVGLGSEG
jgi:hypothetical protein